MRTLALLPVIALSLCSITAGETPPELNEKEVRQIYMKKTGMSPKLKDEVCVVIPEEFPHVAAIGTFANDIGCRGKTYYFNEEFLTLERLTHLALLHYDWTNADKKSDLAMNWTKKVVFAWASPLTSKPKNGFEKDEFFEPKVTVEDHGVEVELWIQEPATSVPEARYFHAKVVYGPKGEISQMEKVEEKVVSY